MSNFDSIQTDKIGFLDIGNSSIKLGLRREDHWEISSFTKAEVLTAVLLGHGIEYLIVSNVRPDVDWLEKLSNHFSIAVLGTDDIPKDKLQYTTPETLGMDRYLACLGAVSLFQTSVVVIDSGSACTIDYMNQEGVFYGGVIMPGIQTLLGVFHKSAPGLPKFDFSIPNNFPGSSSRDSLQWGLSQLYLDGVNANLTRFNEEIESYKLVLTGGDAENLSEHLDFQHEIRPDLIFIGMESFLED
jgi:type III pantothenate kinase